MVLKAISGMLQKAVRKSDIVARYGGEKFAAILPETDLKGGAILAERLRKSIEVATISANEETLNVTISIGVTSHNFSAGSIEKATLIAAADKGLYNAKESGRNRISLINMSN